MKKFKLIVALVLFGAGSANHAWAGRDHHHGHVRFGVTIGPYWGGPWHYPPPYYYAPYHPPIVVQQPAPQVYLEQAPAPVAPPPAPAAAAPAYYWYYCAAANGYYPYVKECPGGWQKVVPQPPGQH